MIYYKVNKIMPIEIEEVEVNDIEDLAADNYFKLKVDAVLFCRKYLNKELKAAKSNLKDIEKAIGNFEHKYSNSARGRRTKIDDIILENKDEFDLIKGNVASIKYYKEIRDKIRSNDLLGVTYRPVIFKHFCDYCSNPDGIAIELISVLELNRVSGQGYFLALCEDCISDLSKEYKIKIKIRDSCDICNISGIEVSNLNFKYKGVVLSKYICTNCLQKMEKLGLELSKEE